MKTMLRSLVFLAFVVGQPALMLAGQPEINVGYFNRLAINGHDPVAYFTQGKPVEGDRDITLTYRGAEWVFATEENRDLFAADPEAYAPQYGGYCAYAASQGAVGDIDPIAFRIYNGKLYLNYNQRVQRTWESKMDDYIADADAIWPAPLNN